MVKILFRNSRCLIKQGSNFQESVWFSFLRPWLSKKAKKPTKCIGGLTELLAKAAFPPWETHSMPDRTFRAVGSIPSSKSPVCHELWAYRFFFIVLFFNHFFIVLLVWCVELETVVLTPDRTQGNPSDYSAWAGKGRLRCLCSLYLHWAIREREMCLFFLSYSYLRNNVWTTNFVLT